MAEMTVEEARHAGLLKGKARISSNERAECDGYTFDSLAEMRRYQELRLLEQAGQIRTLAVHPRFELQPAFKDRRGRLCLAIHYEADFSYYEGDLLVAEDVKGHMTEVFRIKEKLFRFRYPHIDLRIINV